MDVGRELDLLVAEKSGYALPKHEHDKSDGALRCSQCSACGVLWPVGTEKCSCGFPAPVETINPRIPSFSKSDHDALALAKMIVNGPGKSTMDLSMTGDYVDVAFDGAMDVFVGVGKTIAEAISRAVANIGESKREKKEAASE